MIYDVIIAGCGPTGATFANYLGKFGLNVFVFDQEKEIIDYPRAVHIDEDVIRVFQELGLYDSMKQDAVKSFETYALVSKKDKKLFQFQPNSSITEEIPDCNWILQPEIEKHLREGLGIYKNVVFQSALKLQSILQNDEFVYIKLHSSEGTEKEVKGRFLIGCDGGKSLIRKKMNISVTDFGFKKDWFVIDTFYHGKEDFSELHKQFCDPQQPVTYVNGVKNHFRWEFMITKSDFHLSENELKNKFQNLLNKKVDFDDFEIARSKRYTFHTLIADNWRDRRVFLAGDAAHLMPPFLGQGMCSGIKDAKNLSWKIKLAIENWNTNTDKLLDSYYTERNVQVRKIIKLAALLGGFIQYSNLILSPLRNGVLKFINVLPSKPIDRLIENHLYSIAIQKDFNNHFLIGKRMPQPKVINQFGTTYLDNLLEFNWVLLTKENIDFVIQKPVSLSVFHLTEKTPKTNKAIKSDYLSNWFKKQKVDFIILRPDKFIFLAGNFAELTQNIEHFSKEMKLITSN